MRLNLFNEIWISVRDGDQVCVQLFSKHYSKYHYKDGRKPNRFVGPGARIVLVTADGKAMFVWRKFIDASGQQGINCAIFRSEYSKEEQKQDPLKRSSLLILKAERIAWERWPGYRLYTYVAADKIASTNPGCCYKKAGWKICGVTKKRKLLIFEKLAPSGTLP